MDFDTHLKKCIEEAEKSTPEVETKASVLSMTTEDFISEEEARYIHMYQHLPVHNRRKLAHDYNAYCDLKEAVSQFLAIASASVQNATEEESGPLLAKLKRPVIRSPKYWRICGYCNGTGGSEEVAKCNSCGGHGYHV